jgi:trehalose 6-phosphate phosphatase
MSIEWPSGALLLLLDFDGTLVPLAPTPDSIVVPAEVPGLVSDLAARGHAVWIVTGRTGEFVRERLGDVNVVGLHGLDWPGEEMPPRSPALDEAKAALGDLQARGVLIEDKGRSVVFHTRAVTEGKGDILARVEETLASIVAAGEGLEVLHGHEVRELRTSVASKATAVRRLAAEHPELVPAYLGDDVTDEEAMAALGDDAITVRVGDGETCARARLDGPREVIAALRALADR